MNYVLKSDGQLWRIHRLLDTGLLSECLAAFPTRRAAWTVAALLAGGCGHVSIENKGARK